MDGFAKTPCGLVPSFRPQGEILSVWCAGAWRFLRGVYPGHSTLIMALSKAEGHFLTL